MKWERVTAGRPSRPGLWAGLALLAGLAAAALWLQLGLPLPGCAFREWTGLPCATCGSTRMVGALLAGDVIGAMRWNPLVFTLLAGIVGWSALSAARLRLVVESGERRILGALAVVAVVAGWAFVIGSGV